MVQYLSGSTDSLHVLTGPFSHAGELSEHRPGEEHTGDSAQVPQLDTTGLHL